ncbi:hypothetical protein VTO42DRAFT_8214 [Malbranchea cinnamomea]
MVTINGRIRFALRLVNGLNGSGRQNFWTLKVGGKGKIEGTASGKSQFSVNCLVCFAGKAFFLALLRVAKNFKTSPHRNVVVRKSKQDKCHWHNNPV